MLLKCISARSVIQTFILRFSNFLIIALRKTSAGGWFDIILLLTASTEVLPLAHI